MVVKLWKIVLSPYVQHPFTPSSTYWHTLQHNPWYQVTTTMKKVTMCEHSQYIVSLYCPLGFLVTWCCASAFNAPLFPYGTVT